MHTKGKVAMVWENIDGAEDVNEKEKGINR